MEAIPPFVASRYNFKIPLANDEILLFNASSSAVMHFNGKDAGVLTDILSGKCSHILKDSIDQELLVKLKKSGFLVESEKDELEIIKERYYRARVQNKTLS